MVLCLESVPAMRLAHSCSFIDSRVFDTDIQVFQENSAEKHHVFGVALELEKHKIARLFFVCAARDVLVLRK